MREVLQTLFGDRPYPSLETSYTPSFRSSDRRIARRPGHGEASGESGTGPILTSLRPALKMPFTGRTHFFRDHAQRKF